MSARKGARRCSKTEIKTGQTHGVTGRQRNRTSEMRGDRGDLRPGERGRGLLIHYGKSPDDLPPSTSAQETRRVPGGRLVRSDWE